MSSSYLCTYDYKFLGYSLEWLRCPIFSVPIGITEANTYSERLGIDVGIYVVSLVVYDYVVGTQLPIFFFTPNL
jgi:hypothetical protein